MSRAGAQHQRQKDDLLRALRWRLAGVINGEFNAIPQPLPGSLWEHDVRHGGKGANVLLGKGLLLLSLARAPVFEQLSGLDLLLREARKRTGTRARTSAATLARGVLEVSSVIGWVTEPEIDAAERLRRVALWLLKDLQSFRSYLITNIADADRRGDVEQKAELDAVVAKYSRSVDDLEALLALLGMATKRTGNDGEPQRLTLRNAKGAEQKFPTYSDLLSHNFPSGLGYYQRASGIAHGAPWVTTLGMVRQDSVNGRVSQIATADPAPLVCESASLAGSAAVFSVTRMLLYKGISNDAIESWWDDHERVRVLAIAA
jgi:hypothetical protein